MDVMVQSAVSRYLGELGIILENLRIVSIDLPEAFRKQFFFFILLFKKVHVLKIIKMFFSLSCSD